MKSDHTQLPYVGVGLRHAHYHDALTTPVDIDFVEVHAENFMAQGGATPSYLQKVSEHYPISLHCTALGLGSARTMPPSMLANLQALISNVNPMLVSDHACYTWSHWMNKPVHLGDLLPITFTESALKVFAENVDELQQKLQRQILIENLSNYIQFSDQDMSETEFLVRLTELSGCGLLIDLNNILVSAHNLSVESQEDYANAWLNDITPSVVKEIHLAGHTKAGQGELAIDDHSHPVSPDCWHLYRFAIARFGAVPTLVEWDNNLPDWQTLVGQARLAKDIARDTLTANIG